MMPAARDSLVVADAMHSMMRLRDAGADIHIYVEARRAKKGAGVEIGVDQKERDLRASN